MKIVITGKVASGKSTITKLLKSTILPSFTVISLDDLVETAYKKENVKQKLTEIFGTCDKQELSNKVFNDYDALKQLQTVIAPATRELFQEIFSGNDILIEVPYYDNLQENVFLEADFVLRIDADEDIRQERYLQRLPNATLEKFIEINKLQQRLDVATNLFGKKSICFTVNNNSTDKVKLLLRLLELTNAFKLSRGYENDEACLLSGSYDPLTNGHLSIIRKALKIKDKVRILINGESTTKKYQFSVKERFEMMLMSLHQVLSYEDFERITVDTLPSNTLTINYAKKHRINIIIRGLRNSTDFEYEQTLNSVQKRIASSIITLYVPNDPDKLDISSSVVRELFKFSGTNSVILDYVPTYVYLTMTKKLRDLDENKKH